MVIKSCPQKRNEMKRNQRNENEIKRNQRKQNEIENGRKNNRDLKEIKPIFTITMLDYFPHMSDFVSFRFVFVDFVSFRFFFVDFVSFRFVSFLFRFAFIGAPFNSVQFPMYYTFFEICLKCIDSIKIGK
jgi:hypothetical protein